MKKNTYMHFEEESIFYIWSEFQLDICIFDSNILLTKFGPGLWFRITGVGPGFYSFPGCLIDGTDLWRVKRVIILFCYFNCNSSIYIFVVISFVTFIILILSLSFYHSNIRLDNYNFTIPFF